MQILWQKLVRHSIHALCVCLCLSSNTVRYIMSKLSRFQGYKRWRRRDSILANQDKLVNSLTINNRGKKIVQIRSETRWCQRIISWWWSSMFKFLHLLHSCLWYSIGGFCFFNPPSLLFYLFSKPLKRWYTWTKVSIWMRWASQCTGIYNFLNCAVFLDGFMKAFM